MSLGTLQIDGFLRKSSNFNQFAQHLRVTRSRHTGWWIVEELNTAYGYWATIRGGKPGSQYALSDEQVILLLNLPPYLGELHPEDQRFRKCTLCG